MPITTIKEKILVPGPLDVLGLINVEPDHNLVAHVIENIKNDLSNSDWLRAHLYFEDDKFKYNRVVRQYMNKAEKNLVVTALKEAGWETEVRQGQAQENWTEFSLTYNYPTEAG